MEKLVKARKDHKCFICGKPILRSQIYVYEEWKGPTYGEWEIEDYMPEQTGIWYHRHRKHRTCGHGDYFIKKETDANETE